MAKPPGQDNQGMLPFIEPQAAESAEPAPQRTRSRRAPSPQPPTAQRRQAGRRPPPPELLRPRPTEHPPKPEVRPDEPEVLTVGRLDRLIKRVLEGSTANVRVQGEVSGLHRAGSGHCYFTLKDPKEDAIVDCVMYRSSPVRARRSLEEGKLVVLAGRVTIYAPRGRMQFIAEDVLQTRRGALLEALERLKAQLAKEGILDPKRKKPLPVEPRCIAVLTSRDGAAIHDVIRVAFRRGRVRILLVPTPVQGAGAGERIAAAIRFADGLEGVDALLVTRGGGSAEDLAAYNDERVVRAIAAARLPVVSAVGHEIDTSLSDLVADGRAATPSQAAELLVPDDRERRRDLRHLRARLERAMQHRNIQSREHLLRLRSQLGEPRRLVLEQAQHFDELHARLERSMRRFLGGLDQRVTQEERRLEAQHPRRVLAAARRGLDPLTPKLEAALRRRLAGLRNQVAAQAARVDALSPLKVLQRGYAIATTPDGHVLRRAGDAAVGERIQVRLHHGSLDAEITGTHEPD